MPEQIDLTSRKDTRLRKRQRAEMRFQLAGIAAILVSGLALFGLIALIAMASSSAFTRHHLLLTAELGIFEGSNETQDRANGIIDLNAVSELTQNAFDRLITEGNETSAPRPDLDDYIPRLALVEVARNLERRVTTESGMADIALPLSSPIDRHLKTARRHRLAVPIIVETHPSSDLATLEFDQGHDMAISLPEYADHAKILLETPEGGFLLSPLSERTAKAEKLVDLQFDRTAVIVHLDHDAGDPLTDEQKLVVSWLSQNGAVENRFNYRLLSAADSTAPELAGLAGAMIGSILTLLFVAAFAIPIGWLTGIYLQEFAPKGRITSVVEVNINNLAAVPSIVFGLLGAAVLIGGIRFGVPLTDQTVTLGGGFDRGLPIVAGLVLAMLILPTIIIATRSALRMVPQSARDAALALGASPQQTVFHLIVPMASPGILTGTLLALSRALGETAPLLLIGTVAFFAEIPNGPNQPTTLLPVLIYRWASEGAQSWEPMAASATIILMAILLTLNGLALFLRWRLGHK